MLWFARLFTVPSTFPFKSAVTLSKVTSSSVPTGWPIDITPSAIVTLSLPVKWALVSVALGPVYVIKPVSES